MSLRTFYLVPSLLVGIINLLGILPFFFRNVLTNMDIWRNIHKHIHISHTCNERIQIILKLIS